MAGESCQGMLMQATPYRNASSTCNIIMGGGGGGDALDEMRGGMPGESGARCCPSVQQENAPPVA